MEDGFLDLGVLGRERGVAPNDMIPGFVYTSDSGRLVRSFDRRTKSIYSTR